MTSVKPRAYAKPNARQAIRLDGLNYDLPAEAAERPRWKGLPCAHYEIEPHQLKAARAFVKAHHQAAGVKDMRLYVNWRRRIVLYMALADAETRRAMLAALNAALR